MQAKPAFALMVLASFVMAGCVDEASAGKSAPPVNTAAPPPDSKTGQIVGTVTDDSILPIQGATVGILKGPSEGVEGLTDAGGRFVLPKLEPGAYVLVAQRLGYEPSTRSVQVAAGQNAEANFQLAPTPLAGQALHLTLIGDGYFACGADTPVVT